MHITIEPTIPLSLTTTTSINNALSSSSDSSECVASPACNSEQPSPPETEQQSQPKQQKHSILAGDSDGYGDNGVTTTNTMAHTIPSTLPTTTITATTKTIPPTTTVLSPFETAATAKYSGKTYITRVEHFITNIEDEKDTQEIKVNAFRDTHTPSNPCIH